MKKHLQWNCVHCGAPNEVPVDELLVKNFEESIKKNFEEEYLRKESELNSQLDRMRKEIRDAATSESNLKLKMKDKLVLDLQKQLSKMKDRLENSSQQLSGEIQELELEKILSDAFPTDVCEEVPKGINGADCVLHIRSKSGIEIGKILWESKRVQNFNEDWVDKLKKDNLTANCQILVVTTSTMPSDIPGKIGIKDGVYICLFEEETIKNLALILRFSLIKLYEAKQLQNFSKEKSEKLLQYITSIEYKNLFESILKGFDSLNMNFEEEKKKLAQLFKIRQRQLEELLSNTLDVHTSLNSIAGIAIEELPTPSYRKAG